MLDDDILNRNWFVMLATPGREHDAAEYLRGRGATVFMPLQVKQHRPNHHAKRRWTYWIPVMGRYLLVGFTAEVPPWLDILDFSAVAQVVDYRPVRRQTMLRLILEYGAQSLDTPIRRRARTSPEEITAGCDVVVLTGPYFGKMAKVHELVKTRNGKPRVAVLLPILGTDRLVELPLEELEREVA